jgi:hypothetical protein
MKMTWWVLSLALIAAGCDSKLKDMSQTYIEKEVGGPPPVTGLPGTGDCIATVDRICDIDKGEQPNRPVPQATLMNLNGGEFIKGGQNFNIKIKTHDDVVGFNESVIEYKRDAESSWHQIEEKILSINDTPVNVPWKVCRTILDDYCADFVESNDFKIRVTTYRTKEKLYQVTSTGSFIIDSTLPTIGTVAFDASGTKFGFLSFQLTDVSDALSNVGEICVKSTTTPPAVEDQCWNSIKLLGASYSSNISTLTVSVFVGFDNNSSTFYFWVKDRAGNISSVINTSDNFEAHRALAAYTAEAEVLKDKGYIGPNTTDFGKSFTPAWSTGIKVFSDFSTDSSAEGSLYDYGNNSQDATTGEQKFLLDDSSLIVQPNAKILLKQNSLSAGTAILSLTVAATSVSKSSLVLGGAYQTGSTSSVARLNAPIRMGLGNAGILYVLDKVSGSSAKIAKVDIQNSLMTTVVGNNESPVDTDTVDNALSLKIENNARQRWFGTFVVLPNDWIVFTSEDPKYPLKPSSGSRFRLRVYKAGRTPEIESIYFDTDLKTGVNYSVYGNDLNSFVPFGEIAVKFDLEQRDISGFVGRFCHETIVSGTTYCDEILNLKFDADGKNPQILPRTDGSSNEIFKYSKSGRLYNINAYEGTLKYLDDSFSEWISLLSLSGRDSSAYCPNGSLALFCQTKQLKDVFIDNNENIFFIDGDRIRFIDRLGFVRTMLSAND